MHRSSQHAQQVQCIGTADPTSHPPSLPQFTFVSGKKLSVRETTQQPAHHVSMTMIAGWTNVESTESMADGRPPGDQTAGLSKMQLPLKRTAQCQAGIKRAVSMTVNKPAPHGATPAACRVA